jgi:predicted transcriptional regulator
MDKHVHLSRRERQIMDILYTRGESTANQILEDLPDPPSRTSVRTILRILEEKGHVKHRESGREFIFQPTQPREQVARSAIERLLDTFFGGSLEQALAMYLDQPHRELDDAELKRLADLIREARKRGS